MTDLLTRLENAKDGNRELDWAIRDQVCADAGEISSHIAPHYTTSLDAALPWERECYWEISGPRKYLNIPSPVPNYWRAICRREVKALYWKDYEGWGATEALARRIAALRARAA